MTKRYRATVREVVVHLAEFDFPADDEETAEDEARERYYEQYAGGADATTKEFDVQVVELP